MRRRLLVCGTALFGTMAAGGAALAQFGEQETRRPGEVRMQAGEFEVKKLTGEWSAMIRLYAESGAAPKTLQGKASRDLILDGKVLQEVLNVGSPGEGAQRRPGPEQLFGQPAGGEELRQSLALVSKDPTTGEITLVWADNRTGHIHTLKGQHDQATKTINFTNIAMPPGRLLGVPEEDPMLERDPLELDPIEDDPLIEPDDAGEDAVDPWPGQGQQGQERRPAGAKMHKGKRVHVDRAVLRMVDDNRHVLEIFGFSPEIEPGREPGGVLGQQPGEVRQPGQLGRAGMGQRLIEIEYTKGDAAGADQR